MKPSCASSSSESHRCPLRTIQTAAFTKNVHVMVDYAPITNRNVDVHPAVKVRCPSPAGRDPSCPILLVPGLWHSRRIRSANPHQVLAIQFQIEEADAVAQSPGSPFQENGILARRGSFGYMSRFGSEVFQVQLFLLLLILLSLLSFLFLFYIRLLLLLLPLLSFLFLFHLQLLLLLLL